MKESDLRVVVASDVSSRDGIGVELYLGKELLMEVFRDDGKKAREVTLYRKVLPLEIVEYGISLFNSRIPKDFIEYE